MAPRSEKAMRKKGHSKMEPREAYTSPAFFRSIPARAEASPRNGGSAELANPQSTSNNLQGSKDSRMKRIASRFNLSRPPRPRSPSRISPAPLVRTDFSLRSAQNATAQNSSPAKASILKNRPLQVSVEYEQQLDHAVYALKNDFVSGARQLADSALAAMIRLIRVAAPSANTRKELWNLMVYAAQHLCAARPSMGAAVTSCLLRALDELSGIWDEVEDAGLTTELDGKARIAGKAFEKIIDRRKASSMQLGSKFAEWLGEFPKEV